MHKGKCKKGAFNLKLKLTEFFNFNTTQFILVNV